MEFLKDSGNTLDDCEFKFLPKVELEKVLKKVQTTAAMARGAERSGMWNNFCTISSAPESDADECDNRQEAKHVRVMTDDEVESVLRSREFVAPLFGPPRRFNAHKRDSGENAKSTLTASSAQAAPCKSDFSSARRVEEINVADTQQPKQSARRDDAQVQQQTTAGCSSNDSDDDDDDDDTLSAEMEELLRELEENESKEAEEQQQPELSNETEKELICDASDKKFDFRNDDCSASGWQPPLPPPPQPSDAPRTQNQLSCSAEKSSVEHEAVPRDSKTRVRNAVKAPPADANEKSQVPLESSAHFHLLMSKVPGYQEKTLSYLECLGEIICNPPQMIDGNDLSKRKRRSSEFANRFSRNHLYQIGRTSEELRVMHDNPVDIAAKVESLFLHIFQAAQSYLRSVEMFIYHSCPDKLSALVDAIVKGSKACYQRNVYGNRDELFMLILRQCGQLKTFLAINRNSKPTFVEFPNKFLMTHKSRKSCADFKSPYASPYELKKVKSPYAPPKNPYPIPKMKCPAKTNAAASNRSQNLKKSASTQAAKLKLGIKMSDSDVNTMVGQDNSIGGVPKEQVNQLMEMIHNVTKEKISEIVGSVFSQLSDHQLKPPASGEEKPAGTETVEPPSTSDEPCDDERLRKLREHALAERLRMIHAQSENPLYSNQRSDEPWQLCFDVSDRMLEEMLESLVKDFDFGEKSFVESFLKQELSC